VCVPDLCSLLVRRVAVVDHRESRQASNNGCSDLVARASEARKLATEDQRARLRLAKTRGGACAACGKPLADGEPI